MRKNCSSDREKLLKFEAEGREFTKFLKSLEQFIQTVKQFLVTECWRFFLSNKLEQLEVKLEKNIGIKKHAGKVRKCSFLFGKPHCEVVSLRFNTYSS